MRAAPLVLAGLLAGCVAPGLTVPPPAPDRPMALPDLAFWESAFEEGVGYHTYEELTARIAAVAAHPSGLARREVIGESREGRPIEALVLENPRVPGPKLAPLIDGGHHPNEVEGVSAALFTAEFLLANHEANATVRGWVDRYQLWFVPLVNPDGYVAQSRFNAAGVNLNRNYDVAWCHPAAYNSCAPEPVHQAAVGAGANPPEYAGAGPFSEPESRAMRDLVLRLGMDLAFYLTHHTALHCIFGPWVAPDAGAPFPIPAGDQAVFDAVYARTEEHTEFAGGDAAWGTGDCVGYNHGGGSMDWVYMAAHVPAFTMETAGTPALEGRGNTPVVGGVVSPDRGYARDLRHWMLATLPVELLFLANAERLHAWSTELADPPLPEGVPPAPLG